MLLKVVGRDRLAEFAGPASRECADTVWAWLSEIQSATWRRPQELAAAFRDVDLSDPPLALFRLAAAPVLLETVVDFPTGVILVKSVQLDPTRVI